MQILQDNWTLLQPLTSLAVFVIITTVDDYLFWPDHSVQQAGTVITRVHTAQIWYGLVYLGHKTLVGRRSRCQSIDERETDFEDDKDDKQPYRVVLLLANYRLLIARRCINYCQAVLLVSPFSLQSLQCVEALQIQSTAYVQLSFRTSP